MWHTSTGRCRRLDLKQSQQRRQRRGTVGPRARDGAPGMAEPMYRQIADDLRRRIESGELAPASQLPTEIELLEHYDASRNTVRDAIKWLTTLSLIETRPGQGTFVIEKINPFVTTLTGDPETGRGGGEEGVYVAEVAAAHRV